MTEPTSKIITWRRTTLPRNSKRVRVKLRPQDFAKLQRLAAVDADGRREPIASVVERLIQAA